MVEKKGGLWRLRLAVFLLPFLLLLLLDGFLRLMGWLPPEDPLVFFSKTYRSAFSPIVKDQDGNFIIKPDWVSDGQIRAQPDQKGPGRFYLLPGFRPLKLAAEKPADGIRIVALGGSSTFGLGVGVEGAFPAQIEARMRAVLGDRDVEVINLGCLGWASGRVANLMPALWQLNPDLILVYSGHNEMLKGPGGREPKLGMGDEMIARVLVVSPSFAWVRHGFSRWMDSEQSGVLEEEAKALAAGYTPAFDPMEIPPELRKLPSAAYKKATRIAYGENLKTIIKTSSSRKVPILLAVPVPNLLMAPAYSAHSEGFEQESAFTSILNEIRSAFLNRRFSDALNLLEKAEQLSPNYAQIHYWRGVVHARSLQVDDAFASYQRALDLDVRTHRITSGLQAEMLETATQQGAPVIDLPTEFRDHFRTKKAKELFIDHCHPTRLGHQIIADQLYPEVMRLLDL